MVGGDGKKDDKEKMQDMHQHKVAQMIKSAEGSVGLLHKITKPTTMWRSGAQILVMKKRMQGCKDERMGKALAVWRRCAESVGKA